jgi:uncharacterized damage-inducible protein DinB
MALPDVVQQNTPDSTSGAASVVASALHQQIEFLESLPPGLFTAAPGSSFEGTIGAHARHCLDHVVAALDGATSGRVAYDRRERGTTIEADRDAALAALRSCVDRLERLTPEDEQRSVRAEIMLSAAGDFEVYDSTLGRELAFVLSHTIHHHALLSAMARARNIAVPERFCLAPATLAHRSRAVPCAR